MKSKSIFVVSTEFAPGPGGIGSHAYQISKELYALGWDVKVFTEQANCPEEEIISFNKKSLFKIFRLFPTPSMLLLFKKFLLLTFAAIRYRPSIIIGTGKHGAWFGVFVGKLTFRKTVVIGHGTEFTTRMSSRSKKINTWVYSHADAIIHVSNYTKRISEAEGIANKNPFVINNGADDTRFYQVDKNELEEFKINKGINHQRIIITVGNVQPRKGHEFVIRAIPEILRSIPDAHYYCVGPPTIKAHLQEIASELGVMEYVHFTGNTPHSELLNWLNAADLFALPSIVTEIGDREGFGIVVVEAALCGIPAVVTNESGPGEAIAEGETGYGVKEKDVKGIADKMVSLLSNEVLRKAMGDKARMQALEARTWALVIKQYDKVLKTLL